MPAIMIIIMSWNHIYVIPFLLFAGVLLDIQRHYEVTDSGIGLLQTGKSLLIP